MITFALGFWELHVALVKGYYLWTPTTSRVLCRHKRGIRGLPKHVGVTGYVIQPPSFMPPYSVNKLGIKYPLLQIIYQIAGHSFHSCLLEIDVVFESMCNC